MTEPNQGAETTLNTTQPKPLSNLTGALIAGSLAMLAYLFTNMVARKLAATPLPDAATLAAKVSALVRAALLALGTGASMIFAVIAIGLVLLTLKQALGWAWQKLGLGKS